MFKLFATLLLVTLVVQANAQISPVLSLQTDVLNAVRSIFNNMHAQELADAAAPGPAPRALPLTDGQLLVYLQNMLSVQLSTNHK